MAAVFLHHVVGDLTVGKPEVKEFWEGETLEAAMREIAGAAEGAITVWRRTGEEAVVEGGRAPRFVGILNSLDVVAFLAKEVDREVAMRKPVREIVRSNPLLLKEVDPATRLIDALEMMKQGTKRLLVRKNVTWKGMSKRFSVLYNGKWLKNFDSSSTTAPSPNSSAGSSWPSSSWQENYCCLSREDVVRFLIGCLGALAPLPLSSISTLGAVSHSYCYIDASSPALDILHVFPHDPSAAAVVETSPSGTQKIIGEISAYKLWKCDYLAAAWAMANLSAGQFVMGSEDEAQDSFPDFTISSQLNTAAAAAADHSPPRPGKFSSRSIGFFGHQPAGGLRSARSMYRGRSAPLTCRRTSSLAAVMAQMLSHRATHVWVTEEESEENLLVGVKKLDFLKRPLFCLFPQHSLSSPPRLVTGSTSLQESTTGPVGVSLPCSMGFLRQTIRRAFHWLLPLWLNTGESYKMKLPIREEIKLGLSSSVQVKDSTCCEKQSKPLGCDSLPRGIIRSTSNLEMQPLWGPPLSPKKKVKTKASKVLLAMAVGIKQKEIVNQIVKKFSSVDNSVMLFHYDGLVDGWRDLQWSNSALHISAINQTKWWFAKRFLHPDIIADYDYVFLWDEDLGVDHFNPKRYISIIKREGLEISQPGLDLGESEVHHRITVRLRKGDFHRRIHNPSGGGKCDENSNGPPCTGWVEMMAPVFSKLAWRCAWHLIQNDLVHAWGLDYKLGYCAQGDRTEKVGIVDSEYIVHKGIPTLGGSDEVKVGDEHSIKRQRNASLSKKSALAPVVGLLVLSRFVSTRPDHILHFQAPRMSGYGNRVHVRARSYSELLIFEQRWRKAASEDVCWKDLYPESAKKARP
ncbi:CBS domain-containing protein CBSX6 [Apostasia shenzhenica]|uniref:CBS domain-containing protein CBSX6 n=1 Tax=Apostasia shenzhenica TaxID=1088818 RepID=A0A2I0B7Q0_9ASPA|nr:CBS domain-containing protein CBSX6 [Apostasia shenzhenica]